MNIKAAYNVFTEQWGKVTNIKRQSMEFQSIQVSTATTPQRSLFTSMLEFQIHFFLLLNTKEHVELVNIQKDLLKGKVIKPASPLKITVMTIGSVRLQETICCIIMSFCF